MRILFLPVLSPHIIIYISFSVRIIFICRRFIIQFLIYVSVRSGRLYPATHTLNVSRNRTSALVLDSFHKHLRLTLKLQLCCPRTRSFRAFMLLHHENITILSWHSCQRNWSQTLNHKFRLLHVSLDNASDLLFE